MAETATGAAVKGAHDRVLRWGILGNGRIARTVMAALQASEDNLPVAISARDGEKARAAAEEFGLEKGCTYDEMLSDASIDVVYNALPNSLHAEWAVRAANAGKHVLSEKPFATTVDEADEAIAAAKRNNIVMMEAFMYRFHPQWKRVEELVTSGAIGKVRYVTSEFSFAMNDYSNIRFSGALAGGAMMDVGCYCVNFSRYIAGLADKSAALECVNAAANIVTVEGHEVDELCAGTLYFSSGMVAQFNCSLRASGGVGGKIVGEEGFIEILNPWFGGDPAQLQVSQFGKTLKEGVEGGDNYLLEVQHFSQCVRGKAAPLITPDDSRANTVAVEALSRAAKSSQSVEL